MKLSSLVVLISCISICSYAETVTKTNLTFIEASKVSGWNHIGEKHGVYAGLSQAAHKYQLHKGLTSLSSKTLYQLTLVKKLLNWEQQHSNGIEVSLANLNLHVEQLTKLHFKLKLSPEQSIITSDFETLSEKNNWLNDAKSFTKLLSEKANFTLIFYGKNHQAPEKRTLYAAYPFKLPINSKSQWHDINISTNDLNYYWQKNYQEESVYAKDVTKQKWQGFILVAESGNSRVVRNYLPDTFPKEYTEVFNELNISLIDMQISSTP